MDEFELTYLPKLLPVGVLSSPFKKMLDIYVPASIPHPNLRIRKSGEQLEITKKQPLAQNDRSHQIEETIVLNEEEYQELQNIAGKRVAKTRYLYRENNRQYEVDIFEGDLKGLVLVDVEFSSAQEKALFTPPDWLLVEVTQINTFAGGMLCGKKYSDIEEKLTEFGYSPLE